MPSREDELGSADQAAVVTVAKRAHSATPGNNSSLSSGNNNSTRNSSSRNNNSKNNNNNNMNNYLKSYPYLFVRESDQTDYFCTLCDAFLKEEELQAHLFDGHQAEDCSNYFVRVVADNLGQKKYVQICVVCWGKLPSTSDMAAHRASCKIQTNGQTSNNSLRKPDAEKEDNHQSGSSGGPHTNVVGNDHHHHHQEVSKLTSIRPEQLVTTPDIQCYEDMEGPDTSSATSKTSSPPPPAPPNLHHTTSTIGGLNKRGRKKQLHPQQVLTPERIKEVVNNNLVQCGLCEIVIPASDEAKHLQEWHRLTVPLENTSCPLCNNSVPLLELVPHLTVVHAVTPPSTGHALLLWILTSTQARRNNNTMLNNHHLSAMLLQNMLPAVLKNPPPPAGIAAAHSQQVATPTSNILTATPPRINHHPTQGTIHPSPHSSSFLQSLLNGETSGSSQSPTNKSASALPPLTASTPPVMSLAGNSNLSAVFPSLISEEGNKLEYAVTKLTKKHLGLNNARESYQCQVCSKWFAVPPIKHLRGHLVTFKDELRSYIGLINNSGFACLTCFHLEATPQDIVEHVANCHAGVPSPKPRPQQPMQSSPIDPISVDSIVESGVSHDMGSYSPIASSPSRVNNRSGIPTVIADPKGVELDNAGRVKSGKVRKQCELCGQWSNIKWFFKHMSEVHNALFCRCCREYLPIHEQEEHRKFHAEPPYMGQKIRIENGQPIIIDRKERASLTPIGSLAAWGGSSGGMVVKAIDDGTSQLISRKRKGGALPNGGSTTPTAAKMAQSVSKDTLMPKETCPVCGIQITYKNLARHIKLRHKIKYKFCHKCRKFVPNDTYDDHRVTCNLEAGPIGDQIMDQSSTPDGMQEAPDSVDASDYLDMDGASALVINTDDNDDSPNEGDDSKRSNTSKNKLESLLGKEFKHPRRKCGICGYMVSYSNYKRHLKNAHPSINHEDFVTEEEGEQQPKYLGHQVDDDDLDQNNLVVDGDERGDQIMERGEKEDYVECHICGDHILRNFLDRHLKMNHHNEVVNMLGGGNNNLTDENFRENDIQILNNGGGNGTGNGTGKNNIVDVKMRDCPVCQVKMRIEGIVKHCKLKHKMNFKWCRPCEKYILKKQFKTHIQSGEHKTQVNEGEKHSSHEDGEDEDDLDEVQSSSTDLDQNHSDNNAKAESSTV